MADWLRNTMLEKQKTISATDLDLFMVTDDLDAAVEHIKATAFEAGPVWQQPTRATTHPTIPM